MKRFEVTEKARSDLRSIGRYTGAAWGDSKRDTYLRLLARRFQWIADNPNPGAPRPDIGVDYVCFPEGEHLIFYVVMNETVAIAGIPHKRMDTAGCFKKQSQSASTQAGSGDALWTCRPQTHF
jgi:toxin ParE1/3/4